MNFAFQRTPQPQLWKEHLPKFPLLPPIPPTLDIASLPTVYKSVAPFAKKEVEPAGVAYQRLCREALGLATDTVVNGEEGNEKKEALEAEDAKLRAEWERRHQDKLKQAALEDEEPEENLYEVLGIGHLGFNASAKQIKRAYQKMVLIHHPDKQAASGQGGEKQEEEEDPMFLKIQDAWEILGDAKKRRGYDSTFDFDESIPTGEEVIESDGDFYEIYAPVFERNGRFSQKKPVQLLGDGSKSIAEVRKFYQFWHRFESWREFSKFDEFKDGDLEDASCRAEKRWMMRQNESIRSKKKKKEYERIRVLVERASQRDPRLIRAKEAEREKREREKAEKLERKRAEEERLRREKQEKEEKAAKAEQERKEKEAQERKQRQQQKKLRKRRSKLLRQLVEAACNINKLDSTKRLHYLEMIEDVSSEQTDTAVIDRLVDSFGKDATPDTLQAGAGKTGLKELENEHARYEENRIRIQAEKEQKAKDSLARERRAQEEKDAANQAPPWTTAELSVLAKAVKKFPGGVRRRWELIAEYVNTNISQELGTERTKDMCIDKVKSFSQNGDMQKEKPTKEDAFKSFQTTTGGKKKTGKVATEVEWTPEEQKALEAALKKFPATMDKNERWKAIKQAVKTKTKKECVARYKYLRAQIMAKK